MVGGGVAVAVCTVVGMASGSSVVLVVVVDGDVAVVVCTVVGMASGSA